MGILRTLFFNLLHQSGKYLIEPHRGHGGGYGAKLLYLVVKPRRGVDLFIIHKYERDLIRLGISKHTSLDILTQVFHGLLHSSHKNRIKRPLKISCICMKCLAIYSYRNRTTSHKLCLRYLLIKILHSGTYIISKSCHTATSFLPNLSYISSRSYLSNLPHIHLLICPSLYHIRLIGYKPVV